MGRARMAAALITAAGFAAVALPQAASAKATLKLQAEGVTLGAGAPLVAAGANFTIAADGGVGTAVCQNTAMGGEVLTSGSSTSATALFSSVSFGGEAEGGECTSTYESPLAHAHVELIERLPLKLTLPPKLNSATLKPVETLAKPGIEIGIRPLEEHKVGQAVSCFYSKSVLAGGKYQSHGTNLTITFTGQKFGIDANSGLNCKKKNALVSATFTFTSGGIPVTALLG